MLCDKRVMDLKYAQFDAFAFVHVDGFLCNITKGAKGSFIAGKGDWDFNFFGNCVKIEEIKVRPQTAPRLCTISLRRNRHGNTVPAQHL